MKESTISDGEARERREIRLQRRRERECRRRAGETAEQREARLRVGREKGIELVASIANVLCKLKVAPNMPCMTLVLGLSML